MPVDTSSFTPEQLSAYNYAASLAPAKPVASLSSVAGQNITNQNTQTLQKIESNYARPSIVDYLSSGGKASDFASREKLAGQAGIKDYTGTAEQNLKLLSELKKSKS